LSKKRISCINQVRKILDSIWQKAPVKGRCWGKRENGSNPLGGSHITFMNMDSAVSIFPGENGKFTMIQYHRTEKTDLGDEIRRALELEEVYLDAAK